MADLFVTLVSVNPKPSTVTAAMPVPSIASPGGNTGSLYNELGQRQVQVPGQK